MNVLELPKNKMSFDFMKGFEGHKHDPVNQNPGCQLEPIALK